MADQIISIEKVGGCDYDVVVDDVFLQFQTIGAPLTGNRYQVVITGDSATQIGGLPGLAKAYKAEENKVIIKDLVYDSQYREFVTSFQHVRPQYRVTFDFVKDGITLERVERKEFGRRPTLVQNGPGNFWSKRFEHCEIN